MSTKYRKTCRRVWMLYLRSERTHRGVGETTHHITRNYWRKSRRRANDIHKMELGVIGTIKMAQQSLTAGISGGQRIHEHKVWMALVP